MNTFNYKISDGAIRKGLKRTIQNTGLKGRYQILKRQPKVICDTAHNVEGLSLVLTQLKNETYENLHIVLGMVNDKELNSILELFPSDASYYFCKPNIPRGLDAKILSDAGSKYHLVGSYYESVEDAYNKALEIANNDDLIYIGGSTFVVAELPL